MKKGPPGQGADPFARPLTENRSLERLLQHPGRAFNREQLLGAVWGSGVDVDARTVDVHIGPCACR